MQVGGFARVQEADVAVCYKVLNSPPSLIYDVVAPSSVFAT
jgi:hypothetical protein